MKWQFGKKKSLQLTDRKHSGLGILSSLIGLCSLGSFISACFLSSQSHGNGGMSVGVIGLFSFFLCIVGFAIAVASLRQDNMRPLFQTIASLLNGILLLGYLFLYMWGSFAA